MRDEAARCHPESEDWALPYFLHCLMETVSGWTRVSDTRPSAKAYRGPVCPDLSSTESLTERPLALGGQHPPEKQLGHPTLDGQLSRGHRGTPLPVMHVGCSLELL